MRRNRRHGPLFSISLLAFFGLGIGLHSLTQVDEAASSLKLESRLVRIHAADFVLTKQPPENGALLVVRPPREGETGATRELTESLAGFEAESPAGRKITYGFGFEFRELRWRRDQRAEAVVFEVLASYDSCTGERAVEILRHESNVRLDGDELVFDLSVVIQESKPWKERWIGRIGRMDDPIEAFVGGEVEER